MNDPNQDDMLRFYSDVSDAIDIGVMVYNTPWQRHGGIDAATLHKMADFEHIVAIKWATHEGCPVEEMERLAPKFNLIENGSDRVGFHKPRRQWIPGQVLRSLPAARVEDVGPP